MDGTIIGVVVGALVGWIGIWINHRLEHGARDLQALRTAHAEFLARYAALLHQAQLFIGFRQADSELRQERAEKLEPSRLLASNVRDRDPEARALLAEIEARLVRPPNDELDQKIHRQFDLYEETSRHAEAAWCALQLLDPDGGRRALIRSVYEPALQLLGEDFERQQLDLNQKREAFDQLVQALSRTLVARGNGGPTLG